MTPDAVLSHEPKVLSQPERENYFQNGYLIKKKLVDDKWIKPYTDKVMLELADSNHKKILVLSPAFVSDCLETSIEITDRNKKEFIKHGGKEFTLVPSLNDNDSWVRAIIDIINSHA